MYKNRSAEGFIKLTTGGSRMFKQTDLCKTFFCLLAVLMFSLLIVNLSIAMDAPGACYDCHADQNPMSEVSSRDVVLSITCWEGYAKPYIDDFKALIKDKYNLNAKIEIHNPTDQEEFFQAAKNGTSDLISPPIELPKIPRFYCHDFTDRYLQPIVIEHIPNFVNILPVFKNNTTSTFNGKLFGIPYNCGPYGLAYNADQVEEEPKSWNVLWNDKYKNKYTVNNNFPKVNLWISALSLGYSQSEIFDINKLDKDKLQQKLNILANNAKSLWNGAADPSEFPQLSLATTWGFAVAKANQAGGNWKMAAPEEGGTAWIDAWYVTQSPSGIKKRLAEEWINFMLEEKQQADVVKSQGVSPVVKHVGEYLNPKQKQLFNVGNNAYFEKLAFWRVMNSETVNSFNEMWKEAKEQR